jgi:hypothetical protein
MALNATNSIAVSTISDDEVDWTADGSGHYVYSFDFTVTGNPTNVSVAVSGLTLDTDYSCNINESGGTYTCTLTFFALPSDEIDVTVTATGTSPKGAIALDPSDNDGQELATIAEVPSSDSESFTIASLYEVNWEIMTARCWNRI